MMTKTERDAVGNPRRRVRVAGGRAAGLAEASAGKRRDGSERKTAGSAELSWARDTRDFPRGGA